MSHVSHVSLLSSFLIKYCGKTLPGMQKVKTLELTFLDLDHDIDLGHGNVLHHLNYKSTYMQNRKLTYFKKIKH